MKNREGLQQALCQKFAIIEAFKYELFVFKSLKPNYVA
jgi:hypothetical protein